MTWNHGSQYAEILLSLVFLLRLRSLHLLAKYRSLSVFVAVDALLSLIYLADTSQLFSYGKRLDYRLLWCSMVLIGWATTLWLVYALLIAILRQLPGILRFSLRMLNLIFAFATMLALITVQPQYQGYAPSVNNHWRAHLTAFVIVLDRAFSFAELLVILSIFIFVLFFPIRVPRNLAVFGSAISIYLLVRTGQRLAETYLPGLVGNLDIIPFLIPVCLVFWLALINSAGEQTTATLGRGWQTMPKENLVRQLEAMNAALLRSREQV